MNDQDRAIPTIELDCAPDTSRQADLIAGIIEGTPLVLPDEHPTP